MKKQLLALALLGSGMMNAQSFTQDFSGTTAPGLPAGWMQNNVDMKTVVSNLSAYSFGTNAWVTRDMTSLFGAAYGKCVVSTSWYTPAGASNDWLITPAFTVPANAVLSWDGITTDASYPDGYQVKISTTGTTTASFTTNLFSTNAENTTWTNHGVSLNTYSNQTVYIAFVNNSNDKYLLFLDNIKVAVPPANDGNVASVTGLPRYKVGAGNQAINGSFKSLGYSPASNAVLNYNVNGGAVTTQTFTFGAPLSYGQSAAYAFTSQASLVLGTNKVKVWVSHVNGTPETTLSNDTISTTVYVASVSKQRNALIEEFTSSTCGPCASLNSTFDPLLNGNNPNTGGTLNVIKYQVNWPSPGNDPSYNAHSANRVNHYDVSAAPTTISNGTTDMTSHTQNAINAAIAVPAYAEGTASLNVVGTTAMANVTFTPYVTITNNSPLRMFQVILQKAYNYPGASTTQKNYYHVMRKMENSWGTPVTTTDGTALSASFTHTIVTSTTPAQGSFDFWTASNIVYEYVAFIQDTVSNDILNTASANFTTTATGLVELENDKTIGVYPNPAKDFAAVAIKLQNASTADLSIYDVTGKLVYSNKGASLDAGKSEININTSEFATGTYNIVVRTKEGVFKEKLIVVK